MELLEYHIRVEISRSSWRGILWRRSGNAELIGAARFMNCYNEKVARQAIDMIERSNSGNLSERHIIEYLSTLPMLFERDGSGIQDDLWNIASFLEELDDIYDHDEHEVELRKRLAAISANIKRYIDS
ncbi:hypothetical protein [Acidipropionibacterium acidipropionici]|uniref:hypothetical protein n=1 Tax=Acidipropionibacterium acidipropionici TaxID=1748 RepID=UPI0012B62C68|nr:hypothetical protein [Acidipropionibacterium acidipropionici]